MFVSALMEDCKLLAPRIPQVHFRHCYREANRCADALARMGGSQATNFVFLACPRMDLVKLLDFNFQALSLVFVLFLVLLMNSFYTKKKKNTSLLNSNG